MAVKTLDEILKQRIAKLDILIEQLSKIDDKDVAEAVRLLINYRQRIAELFEREGLTVIA